MVSRIIDGRMFIAGGNKDQQLSSIVQTHLFDPTTNLWSLGPNMAARRWYPTVTPLSNGGLITSGRVDTPECGRWPAACVRSTPRRLACRCTRGWTSPRTAGPSTRVDQTLRARPDRHRDMAALGQRDTINRDYGGHALFDVGKVLVAGGGPSTKDARVVDFNGATPRSRRRRR
jgi:hypothetical protein